MVKVAIYLEGGGPTQKTQDLIRRGFTTFLWPVVQAARMCGGYVRPVVCGGRRQAYDYFCDALVKSPDVCNMLLVDSEDPVTALSPWTHLLNRPGDGWIRPASADDTSCHLMVVCMEAWFLADPEGMKKHFGGNFDPGKLPPANQAETRTKAAINDALKNATRNTKAGEYRKIRDGAKLLEKVNPAVVRRHCAWCQRLFARLENAVGPAT